MNYHAPSLIERKRDGGRLEAAEIKWLIECFTAGTLAEAQMSALAMAIYFRGMDDEETAQLTHAMLSSGSTLEYPAGHPPIVDKHSTGGIGDKVSLILAPLLACDEVWVPMISGRGLGITGGTLDKLESIPGFNVTLEPRQLIAQLEKIRVVMVGQTRDICPADKKLYALRDVTGTVPSQPLIVASIMSKKLAENLNRLVLDVKFGSGAFMKTEAEARELAEALTRVGDYHDVHTRAVLSPMDEPLGHAVGNALEVAEAVAVLQGGGPADLVDLTLDLAALVAEADRETLARWLKNGRAWDKFVALVEAQGGDSRTLETLTTRTWEAPVIGEMRSEHTGRISRMDAGTLGRIALTLGAGRAVASDAVDFSVGFDQIRKIGDTITRDDVLLRVHARTEAEAEAAVLACAEAIEIEEPS